MIGVLTNGQKVILAVESGQRESKESWGMILRDLRKRGLKPWRCTIADGHLGLWAALGEQYPTLAEQRCWNHRLTNVLDACRRNTKLTPVPCCVPCRMLRPKQPAKRSGRSSPLATTSWPP